MLLEIYLAGSNFIFLGMENDLRCEWDIAEVYDGRITRNPLYLMVKGNQSIQDMNHGLLLLIELSPQTYPAELGNR